MIVSKTLFTANVESSLYVTEASDLPGFCPGEDLILTCELSERRATFAWSSTARDNDNDIMHWNYLPTPHTLEQIPRLKGWSIVVIND